MATDKEIEDLIAMLDGKIEAGESRVRIRTSNELEQGQMESVHHHGRCDVGSAWATGKVRNEDCIDIPNVDCVDTSKED